MRKKKLPVKAISCATLTCGLLLAMSPQQAAAQLWQQSGSKIYYNGGNVGINYADPIDLLHVHGSSFFFGNIRLGIEKNDVGQGSQLIFNDHGNTDPIWMARYNTAFNASELRVNLGDDGTESDKMVLGYSSYPSMAWTPKYTFNANGKLNIDGSIHLADFANGIYSTTANSQFRMNERYIIQATNTGLNQWTRGTVAQNIQWNSATNQWDIPSTVSDFSMWKYESNGNISIYANTNTGSAYSLTESQLDQYKRIWITGDGRVAIGNTNPGSFKLAVDGKMAAREIKVTLQNPWPDYVFDKDRQLMSIASLEAFIAKNKHLPDMPSAQEVKEAEGIELGEMNRKLVEKIEELTLYIIELKKDNEAIKQQVEKLAQQRP